MLNFHVVYLVPEQEYVLYTEVQKVYRSSLYSPKTGHLKSEICRKEFFLGIADSEGRRSVSCVMQRCIRDVRREYVLEDWHQEVVTYSWVKILGHTIAMPDSEVNLVVYSGLRRGHAVVLETDTGVVHTDPADVLLRAQVISFGEDHQYLITLQQGKLYVSNIAATYKKKRMAMHVSILGRINTNGAMRSHPIGKELLIGQSILLMNHKTGKVIRTEEIVSYKEN